MSNRLSTSSSPYLLQHAENPVDWFPWGTEALDRAKQANLPIFLSIGYAACHWCHVMAHESFEDPRVAGFINQHFVPVKVDREERPDLDSIYMNAVVAMTGQGGWPLSLFLTPDGRPFYGGTYFPPVPQYNLPSFQQVIQQISAIWDQDHSQINRTINQLEAQIKQQMRWSPDGLVSPQPFFLGGVCQSILDQYDWKDGGWGSAPKFPQPMVIEFLLTQSTLGNENALKTAHHVLQTMLQGGMYDLVGGGFHRYSTDSHWRVPHFEKMLYDNAQLALAYLHGFVITGEAVFKSTCEDIMDFISRELTHPEGGFYSSLDADTIEGEGSFYQWPITDIYQAIGSEPDFNLFKMAHGLPDLNSAANPTILRRAQTDQTLAESFHISQKDCQIKLQSLYKILRQYRQARPRPATDDKIIVAWNGLALKAFAEAACFLKRPDYLLAAQKNAVFILEHLFANGQLIRSWRQGQTGPRAYLEDYASLALGLLSLYQADHHPSWFLAAHQLIDEILLHFQDPDGGFFDTRDDHERLIVRPKEIQDNATPAGNSLAVSALLKLSAITGDVGLPPGLSQYLLNIQEMIARYPLAFGNWLNALDFRAAPIKQVAVMANDIKESSALVDIYWEKYRPHAILAVSQVPPFTGAPDLVQNRQLINGKPTVYICEGFHCLLPVTRPGDMRRLLIEKKSP